MSHNNEIYLHGSRTNNLKNINVSIPKNKLVVVTGVSGSGKSSLIMDTLYAEGQRRYVESLSSYARQFLNRMKKPDIDYIRGVCPAIAIEQRAGSRNRRSTVGTLTEIYDHLRMLYARIGKTISPISGEEVKRDSVSDVVDALAKLPEETRFSILSPIPVEREDRKVRRVLEVLRQKGFARILWQDEVHDISEFIEKHAGNGLLQKEFRKLESKMFLLIDRLAVKKDDEEFRQRAADSIQTAYNESHGIVYIKLKDGKIHHYSNRFEKDGIRFLEPTPALFNYNNPYGACPKCEGYGKILGVSERRVVPDNSLSVYEGAVTCWSGEKSSKWLNRFINNAKKIDFPIHRPYGQLTKEEKDQLWYGIAGAPGIYDYFSKLEEKSYKIQNRVIMARFRGRSVCPLCRGARLKKEALYVKVGGRPVNELTTMPVDELLRFFRDIKLSKHDQEIASRLITEIMNRLVTMDLIGLGYLQPDRLSSTLSGGEIQRIYLTRTLGSNLTHSVYILDEPSIGLHPRDTEQLIKALHSLKELGNTVVVVEHEEDIIRQADHILEIGPGAGVHGGEVVYSGPYGDFLDEPEKSLTAGYLTGEKYIPSPLKYRKPKEFIHLKGAGEHNLQAIDVKIPLHAFTVVSGVSGSGKSTLVHDILYPLMMEKIGQPLNKAPGAFQSLEGEFERVTDVQMVDQKAIGRSSRSNPATYVKVYDHIRKIYADQPLAQIRDYTPGYFSFNVDGGRCETCKGDGVITVEMQFLADVELICETCNGRRFKDEVLEVKYKGKSIYDILEMPIEVSLDFFADEPAILQKLEPLNNVGLGYLNLGQSSSTLSGGESQRVKLAYYLGQESISDHILFIFDEPTTGLHFDDIRKLLLALNALIERGHSVIVVEHNLDVVKNADWVIDLGPGGGKHGGQLVYQGPVDGLLEAENSYTGQYLKQKVQN